jgi:acyl carrier protein
MSLVEDERIESPVHDLVVLGDQETKIMKMTMTDQEIFGEVQKAICTVLRVSGSGIQPATTLIGDLGAESIDFLDLGCDLEKIVDAEVDFRKLFEAKKAKGSGAVLDVSIQEVVDYLKTQVGAAAVATRTVAVQ